MPLRADSLWPLAEVSKDRQPRLVSALEMEFQASFPSGPWQQPPSNAVVLPIMPSGETGREGFLIAGLNPFRLFDDNYSGFMKLVAGQIAAAIANAEAYEQERRRAEALAELDHAKTAFFSNVSHEFRTPLTLMLGPLEDALSHAEELPPQRREEVTVAHRNALRLLRLVNTLLDFSRVEAGRIEVHFEKTDLCVLTRDIASNFYSVCERANLTLLIDCDPHLPTVYVDRQMWEKIVLNLVSNAFKFTFAGSIEVLLREAGESVELTVRDTGVGIPASELPHVFERFHRVEGQRGRTHEGSGIGLALVRELVALHDGTVRVDSEVGHGTAFTIMLPYGKLAAKADEKTAHQPAEPARATAFVEEALRWLPQDGKPSQYAATLMQDAKQGALLETSARDAAAGPRPRILIADDNADMRDYLRRLLVPHFDVETVGNGIEALQAIGRTRPDLLLSDVMMPGKDGFALLHEIRADAALSGLPVILLSARAGEEAKVEGLNAGADDYLIKPFSTRELLARVNTNIAMSRLRREIAAEVEMQKTQLQAVLDTVPVAVWFTYDAEARHATGNRCACELLRLPGEANASLSAVSEGVPHHFRVFKDGVELPVDMLPLQRAARGETVHGDEIEICFTDGSAVAILTQASPLRDPSGKVIGAVCAALDISERKRTEDHRMLLLNELNHRVKNTLAIVQSIAAQSLRSSQSTASGRKSFEARLMALSRAHDVLTAESWQGANLDEIIAQAIAPYRGPQPNRIAIEGPPIRLPAKMALSFSMALHELATNAAKYGALSDHKGTLKIAWHVERNDRSSRLRLEWRELDGPPVVPPQHKGFGSRLIERGLAQELNGEAKMEYLPDGLRCAIEAQIDRT